jgi:hypothetical protein
MTVFFGERWDAPFVDHARHGLEGDRQALQAQGNLRWHDVSLSRRECAQQNAKAAVRAEVMKGRLGDSHVDPCEVMLRLVIQSAARAEMCARPLEEASKLRNI